MAALSARLLAESAHRGGFSVVAMDLFGDVDTRRAAAAWTCIGEPVTMKLDPERTLAALEAFGREHDIVGWIAGSGFEAIPETLARGADVAPLIGNPLSVIERARDPRRFFGRLDALGIPHPPTSFIAPASRADWLLKDAGGSGAWHIRAADADDAQSSAATYFQRRMPGRSLGALFIANGRRARILGVSEQTIRARHGHPYVYCGIVGPIALPPAMAERIHDAVQALVEDLQLVGLNGLDFLLDGDDFFVLEVNARPSSSLALYDADHDRGLVRAHVDALLQGALPDERMASRTPRGDEIVFAERACRASAGVVARLVDSGWCHDIPRAGTDFVAGEPLCTVSAQAPSIADVHALLAERRERARAWLESLDE